MQFEWNVPTRIVFGAGRFAQAHKLVRGLGKRAYIMTSRSFGPGGARAAVLDALVAQLRSASVETEVFAEVEPNPRTATIDRAAARARELRPRYVLALGGGSVMDAAKCVALLCENEGGIYEYSYRGPGKPMRPFNHALPVVCIPTIAATSSETSRYAVVKDEGERRKTTVFGEALRPALALIDPELTYSMSPRQTIDGAFDMITHVIESYLTTPEPAPLQDNLTEAIVETVVTHLPLALSDPRHALARAQLSWCGSLALSGVLAGREGAWPIHAIESGLNAATDCAHGRGLSFVLPRLMAFDEPVIGARIARFNQRIFGTPTLEGGLKKFMREVGAWTELSDLLPRGASPEAVIESALDHTLEVHAILKRGQEPYLDNVRPLRRAELRELLTS